VRKLQLACKRGKVGGAVPAMRRALRCQTRPCSHQSLKGERTRGRGTARVHSRRGRQHCSRSQSHVSVAEATQLTATHHVLPVYLGAACAASLQLGAARSRSVREAQLGQASPALLVSTRRRGAWSRSWHSVIRRRRTASQRSAWRRSGTPSRLDGRVGEGSGRPDVAVDFDSRRLVAGRTGTHG
jgi:hypothetical protein